jgi:OOP family OmpA-OmpF porin
MADSPDLPPISPDPATPEGGAQPGVSYRPVAAPSSGWVAGLSALWTWLVRLLVLGVSVSAGWLLGMAIAQFFPSRSPSPPIAELALRQSSQTSRKLRQLPGWWQGDSALDPSTEEPAPVVDGQVEPAEAEPPADLAAADLSPEERDRIQTDLVLLQQDLVSLSTRLQTLESTVGTSPTGTLEERLNRLDQRLDSPAATDPTTDPGSTDSEATSPQTVALVPYQEPAFPLVSDRILLPSALLFEPGSSILTGPGQQLLDSIAADLRRYGPVTLLVGSHTDPTIVTDGASQLTLQQSMAVQQHLAPQIEGPRWVPLGYGYSRPRTTGTTPADQQRNQRVEIGVVPRS